MILKKFLNCEKLMMNLLINRIKDYKLKKVYMLKLDFLLSFLSSSYNVFSQKINNHDVSQEYILMAEELKKYTKQ